MRIHASSKQASTSTFAISFEGNKVVLCEHASGGELAVDCGEANSAGKAVDRIFFKEPTSPPRRLLNSRFKCDKKAIPEEWP
jgi:hypothetical protein